MTDKPKYIHFKGIIQLVDALFDETDYNELINEYSLYKITILCREYARHNDIENIYADSFNYELAAGAYLVKDLMEYIEESSKEKYPELWI